MRSVFINILAIVTSVGVSGPSSAQMLSQDQRVTIIRGPDVITTWRTLKIPELSSTAANRGSNGFATILAPSEPGTLKDLFTPKAPPLTQMVSPPESPPTIARPDLETPTQVLDAVAWFANGYGEDSQIVQARKERQERVREILRDNPSESGVLFRQETYKTEKDGAAFVPTEVHNVEIGTGTLHVAAASTIDELNWKNISERKPNSMAYIYVDPDGNETYLNRATLEWLNHLEGPAKETLLRENGLYIKFRDTRRDLNDQIDAAKNDAERKKIQQERDRLDAERKKQQQEQRQRETDLDRYHNLTDKVRDQTATKEEHEEFNRSVEKMERLSRTGYPKRDDDGSGVTPKQCNVCRKNFLEEIRSDSFAGNYRFLKGNDDQVRIYKYGEPQAIAIIRARSGGSPLVTGAWTNAGITVPAR